MKNCFLLLPMISGIFCDSNTVTPKTSQPTKVTASKITASASANGQCDTDSCQSSIKLSNGVLLPLIGLGTAGFTEPLVISSVLNHALGAGYRLLDTADLYRNHQHIASALAELLPIYGLDRKDIFIITKVRPVDLGYNKCKYAVRRFMEELDTNYIDLVLIHSPDVPEIQGMSPSLEQEVLDRAETWKCLQEFYSEGLVRSVGVSNYNKEQLEEVVALGGVLPQVNQVHHTPFYQQKSLLDVCHRLGVHLQAYSSLGYNILRNKIVNEVGERYGKSAAQVLLKWTIQQGFSVIPKSRNNEHLKQNIDLEFNLKESDMKKLSSLMRHKL